MSGSADSVTTSALDSTKSALSNIALWNPRINAMLRVFDDSALATAEMLDREAAQGRWRGLLHGMTISLKDNVDVAGTPTTAATRILADNVPRKDAYIVERLRRNGAIIVGKANLHEWVFGPTTQSKHFGPCYNPWKADHLPGGSSGGSGASVASGMCVGSIGSDTGGSIRIPASFNGVAGLRPTVGRISNRGSIAVSAAFDTLGPLARRVADVARIFAAIAGHDEEDPISQDVPVPDVLSRLNGPVAGMRLGVMRHWFFDDLHPDLSPALERALDTFRQLGVEIIEIDLGDVEKSQDYLGFRVVMADGYHIHKARMEARRAEYGDDVFGRLMIGAKVTGDGYAEAMRWFESFRHRLRTAFKQVDAIFAPTTPTPAIPASTNFFDAIRQIPRLTCAWPAAGVPALAVPCGFSGDELPLSFQLAGPWFSEDVILRLGHAFQCATDHHLRTPSPPEAPRER